MIDKLLNVTVKAIDEKLGKDIIVLNMDGISPIVDYFIICHGNNERHIQAIANEIKDKAFKNNFTIDRIEGLDGAKWVLVDIGDIVVHVFDEEERYNYHLEKLWGDVPRVDIEEIL